MDFNDTTRDFILQHHTDDVYALALQAGKYPGVDMPAAITQIAGWQAARDKIPSWAAQEDICYPAHLPLEQCSSETTARHKSAIIAGKADERNRLADLTGGFGIDFAFMAPLFCHADYVERQEALCALARHNFSLLGLHNVEIHQTDSVHFLGTMPHADWIFIDPARRDSHGGKTVAIGDCEPDVAALESLLLEKATRVMVKLSPMLDLTQALYTLQVEEAHLISVANECKELLLVLNRGNNLPPNETPIHCTNLQSRQPTITFTRRQEKESPCPLSETPRQYLYEPNASLLKAGAFRYLCQLYPIVKLHPNSHLYTSDQYLPDFPGRKFRIEGHCAANKKEAARLLSGNKQANLTVRNFPIGVNELRKRLGLSEGGDRYIFATTLANGQKALLCGRPIKDSVR